MRISTVTLAIAPGRSSATRKLTVSYQAIFSPVEVAAKQVVAETVFVQPDRGWIDRYQGYLESYGYGTLVVSNLKAVAPQGAIVATAATIARKVSWEIGSNLLDVFQVVGPYDEEQVGILDSISAHVELKPYSPPAPIAADSNVVQGEW